MKPMIASGHTCTSGGRLGCDLCMQLEKELWDAINDYAISVGGNPAKHVYGNTPRMRAVAEVSRIVDRVSEVEALRKKLCP